MRGGANSVSVHYEACRHLDGTLEMIRKAGAMAGVVLNPATPVAVLEDVLEVADYVLLMSVNPGFGGQKLIPYVLEKVRKLDRHAAREEVSAADRNRWRRAPGKSGGSGARRV